MLESKSKSADLPAESLVPRVPVKWTPHPYQKKAVGHLLENGGAGLFLDPGLGKTSIVLEAIRILKAEGLVKRVLVIAPLRPVYDVWPDELTKWTNFAGLSMGILHGKHKDKVLGQDHDIYVINPDGLNWLMCNGRMKKLGADTLVIDESTRFKHANTLRFKTLKPQLPKFSRRWILTGTPMPKGYMDLFGQIYIVDLGHSLGSYISHYRMEHFEQTGFGGFEYHLKESHDKIIEEKIRPFTLRLDAKDYLDLPSRINNYINVELPPSARAIYDEMEAEMVAELSSGQVVSAVSSGAAAKKCEQIANGGMYYTEEADESQPLTKLGRMIALVHNAKTQALLDLQEELYGDQMLVAYEFQHDLKRLMEALGKDTPYIGSGVTPVRATQIKGLWNAQRLPVLLGQPQSMAHGLNLQTGGKHVVWHSIIWDFENYDQFIKRLERQGSIHKHIHVHHIIAKDTVDEAKMFALNRKDKTQKKFLDALRVYVKRRGY
jgi:SNF2 family DNA or RNA helicase